MCSYVTSRKHRIISHMKGHGEMFCIHCDYSTKDLSAFQSHLKHCSLTCHLCNCTFRSQKYDDHMLRFHNQQPNCCKLCNFSTMDAGEFERHELKHFRTDSASTCSKCQVSFDSERQCEVHILNVHTGDEAKGNADEVFEEWAHLVQQKDDRGEAGSCFECRLCGYESEHVSVMKNHVDIHTALTGRFQASNSTLLSALKKEQRNHAEHQNGNFDPKIMVQGQKCDDILVKMREENDIYDADTGGLIGHGSGSWKCTFCPTKAPFRYKRSYEKHIAQHFTNMSANVATALGNVFSDLSDDNRDRASDEVCPICEARFSTRWQFKDHLETVHETHVVAVGDCEDSLEKEEDGGGWEDEGRRHTEMWIKQQDFTTGHTDIGNAADNMGEDSDSSVPSE